MATFEVEFQYISTGRTQVSAEDEEMAADFCRDAFNDGDIYVDPGGGCIEDSKFNIIEVKPIKEYEVEYTFTSHQKTSIEATSEEDAKRRAETFWHDPDEYCEEPVIKIINIKELKEDEE